MNRQIVADVRRRNPERLAMRPRSSRFAPNSGSRCAIQTKSGLPPVLSIVTVTGPIPRCNVASTLADVSAISPRVASTQVVPTVGCPAIGISRFGVKILTRRAPDESGGITNVDSLKFISCASPCISLALSAAAISKNRELITAERPRREYIDEDERSFSGHPAIVPRHRARANQEMY